MATFSVARYSLPVAMQTLTVVFGGGCFWCTEAVFSQLRGVVSVTPGYAGGHVEDPEYKEVCSGKTGHAEVVLVEYDQDQISFHDLLTVFFASHDPTQLNRQGNDVGTQYRSIILTTTSDQKQQAESFIADLTDDDLPVVTQVEELPVFYEAEEEHLKFYERNPTQAYCQVVINPKLEKLQKEFQNLLKQQT